MTPKRGERIDPSRPTQVGRLGAGSGHPDGPGAFAAGPRPLGAALWYLAGTLAAGTQVARHQDIEEANQFLRQEYVGEFNARFCVPASPKGSAFVRLRRKDPDWIFSVKHERTVNNDNTIAFERRFLRLNMTRWKKYPGTRRWSCMNILTVAFRSGMDHT